jgi:hypothetical protein
MSSKSGFAATNQLLSFQSSPNVFTLGFHVLRYFKKSKNAN